MLPSRGAYSPRIAAIGDTRAARTAGNKPAEDAHHAAGEHRAER